MIRARTAAIWTVLLTLSYFYWSWVATNIHDGKTIRAALIFFVFMVLGGLALLVKIFGVKPPPA